ncbi:MAG: GAF domain-containing protein [Oscillospiraceae bacterium]|jgi:GAF domain-containing protein|nr:GAF domain-containing protein [Oscillospiraceae bacterium]
MNLKTQDPKENFYATLLKQAQALISEERNKIANLANISALLSERLENLNWAGFYLSEPDGSLVLGPFQGKPACVRIPLGKGVCGTAALSRKSQLVPDVHQFPGHIACDSATNSELVVPLLKGREVMAVMDLDSAKFGRFDSADAFYLEKLAEIIINRSDF